MTSSNRRMLVVGNGFDLAHGLPTRYQDMLEALSHDYCLMAFTRRSISVTVIIPLLSISANIKICPVGLDLKVKYNKL